MDNLDKKLSKDILKQIIKTKLCPSDIGMENCDIKNCSISKNDCKKCWKHAIKLQRKNYGY